MRPNLTNVSRNNRCPSIINIYTIIGLVLVLSVPVILYYRYQNKLESESNRKENLIDLINRVNEYKLNSHNY
jgi:hypothetical protein